MTEQEFEDLLKNIEDNKFVGNELAITTRNFEEDIIEGSFDFNDTKIILLVETLKKNPCITKLDLYHNNISVIGATTLANVVSLKLLDLSSNNIYYSEERHEQFLNMIEAFINNKNITSLHFNDCYIPDGMIAQLIKNNYTIKHLTLSRHLTDEALEFIKENTSLEGLSISSHEITDKGVEYILKNTSLKELGITQGKITDIGVKLLSNHPTLKTLYIDNNEIIINDTVPIFFESESSNYESQREVLSQKSFSIKLDSNISQSYEQEITYDKNQESEESDVIGQSPEHN
jgi:Leucine-rich repeat (LRR) protein